MNQIFFSIALRVSLIQQGLEPVYFFIAHCRPNSFRKYFTRISLHRWFGIERDNSSGCFFFRSGKFSRENPRWFIKNVGNWIGETRSIGWSVSNLMAECYRHRWHGKLLQFHECHSQSPKAYRCCRSSIKKHMIFFFKWLIFKWKTESKRGNITAFFMFLPFALECKAKTAWTHWMEKPKQTKRESSKIIRAVQQTHFRLWKKCVNDIPPQRTSSQPSLCHSFQLRNDAIVGLSAKAHMLDSRWIDSSRFESNVCDTKRRDTRL